MSSLSKLNFNSGVKTLVSATASNKQQVNALLNENKSNNHGLKLWQLGLLIGIIAQAAVQDSRVMEVVKATLEENPHRV